MFTRLLLEEKHELTYYTDTRDTHKNVKLIAHFDLNTEIINILKA